MSVVEVNFDGIVGPTHNYAGLSRGNKASESHAQLIANPKAAALQGLKKMKTLADQGFAQAILPPHLRPHTKILDALGFSGTEQQQLDRAWRDAPEMTASLYSASAMWTANAATVSPGFDTQDGKTHFTPANLSCMFHRSLEHPFTGRVLQQIFSDQQAYAHHHALPAGLFFGDEGAANHTRLCAGHGAPGVEVFVYGEKRFSGSGVKPVRYPARQSYEASAAIARLHGLTDSRTVFIQQSPEVIDKGVFHNDVIAVGSGNLMFFHEHAFLDKDKALAEIEQKLDCELHRIEVKNSEVSVERAVATYLFNTQILDVSKGSNKAQFVIVAPTECEEDDIVSSYLQGLVDGPSPIQNVLYFDLRESMKNGGGPACLRLRVVMSEAQINNVQAQVFMNDTLYEKLVAWVEKNYRDRLAYTDLRDPLLTKECQAAMTELESIIQLPNLYQY